MNASSSRGVATAAAAILLALVAAFAVVMFGVAPGSSPAEPSPSAPVVTPSPSPSPSEPVVTPSPAPSDPADGDFVVDLDVATPHDVKVIVKDGTGSVTDARSGRAGDGMSVRWGDVKVENVDADTIRVTWVGLPGDVDIDLGISKADDAIVLDFDQPGPPANSDALGYDRVLELDFDAPVDAGDVKATFPEPAPAS